MLLLLEGEVVDKQSEMPESRRARSAALAAAEVVEVVVEAEGGCCVHWAEATESVDSGTDSE